MVKIKKRTLNLKLACLHIGLIIGFALIVLLVLQGSFYQLTRAKDANLLTSFFIWTNESPMMFLENFLIIMFWMFLFYFLTTNLGFAVFFPSAAIFLLGFVNYIKYTMRTAPLYPDELSLIRNIGSMVHLVDVKIVVAFFLIIIFLLFIIVLLLKYSPFYKMPLEYRLPGIIVFFFLSASSFVFEVNFSNIQKATILLSVIGFLILIFLIVHRKTNIRDYVLTSVFFIVTICTMVLTYNYTNPYLLYNYQYARFAKGHYMGDDYIHDGIIHSFLNRITLHGLREPDDYSKRRIEGIASYYNGIAEQENKKIGDIEAFYNNTNIIFIMSEAFSDPTVFPEFVFSQDPIPYTRQLLDSYTSTDIIVPGYGGATIFPEVDALTSFEMNTIGYNGFATFGEQLPTFVNFLNHSGYRTVAIHPNESTFYRRDSIYSSIGFQEFIDLSKMTYTENLSALNKNTSDAAIFHELMDLLKDTEEPLFAHLVTIQNHGPYPRNLYEDYKDSSVTVTSSMYNDESMLDSLGTYATGLKISDQELEILIEQVEQLNEPTVLVFWGDHLPVGYPNDFFEESSYTKEKHATPFFIYSNFKSSQNSSITSIGANDILWVMKDQFLLPKTGMETMLKELSYLKKGHAEDWYLDKNNVIRYYDESRNTEQEYIDLSALEYDYYLIQYDILIGKSYSKDMGFFE